MHLMTTTATVTQPKADQLMLTVSTNQRGVPVHVEVGVGSDTATADATALRAVIVTDLARSWTYQTETDDHTKIVYTAPV